MNELQENLKTHMESTTGYRHDLIDRAVAAVFRGDTRAPEVVECLDRTGLDVPAEMKKIEKILPHVQFPAASRESEPSITRIEK